MRTAYSWFKTMKLLQNVKPTIHFLVKKIFFKERESKFECGNKQTDLIKIFRFRMENNIPTVSKR